MNERRDVFLATLSMIIIVTVMLLSTIMKSDNHSTAFTRGSVIKKADPLSFYTNVYDTNKEPNFKGFYNTVDIIKKKRQEKIAHLFLLWQREINKKKQKHMVIKKEINKKPIVTHQNSELLLGNFIETSYIALCDTHCSGVTASGLDVRSRTTYNGLRIIAADKNIIPMYSIVKIKSNNYSYNAIVLDTGSAIIGHHIDLLVQTNQEAQSNGVQNVKIYLLRRGK